MTREEAIKSMYHYEAEVEDMALVTETQEVIHSWYMPDYETPEALEEKFSLEELYDAKSTCMVYVKDRYMELV